MNPTPILGFAEIALRLGSATAVGCAVGLNRDLHGKPAGLRTHALVSLGSAVLALAILHVSAVSGAEPADAMSRTIQGIVTGIGFLGGGVILRHRDSHVHGLTTAATVWLTAALGVLCGVGCWTPLLVAVALLFLVLLLGGPIEELAERVCGKAEHRQP